MMRPFNRGLKTLITTGLVVMLAVTFLAPAVSALQWDPSDPPVYPWMDSNPRTPEQDDTPWEEQNKSSGYNDGRSFFSSFDFWYGSFLQTLGIRFIIFETAIVSGDSGTITDIQSGVNNGSN